MGSHSSWRDVAAALQQPTRTTQFVKELGSKPACPGPAFGRNLNSGFGRDWGALSLFGLAPGGVYHAAAVAGRAVRSYRTLSPLPRSRHRNGRARSAVCSLWHFP